jgi:Host cell surface-exposed lipoprotein
MRKLLKVAVAGTVLIVAAGVIFGSNGAKTTGQTPAAVTAVQASAPAMTTAQQNAVDSAHQYLSFEAFSKKGLIQQLSSSAGDGYPRSVAVWAVNHIRVNWNQQAVKSARNYLSIESFSRNGLVQQLSSSAGDGFTLAQAEYGVSRAYR